MQSECLSGEAGLIELYRSFVEKIDLIKTFYLAFPALLECFDNFFNSFHLIKCQSLMKF